MSPRSRLEHLLVERIVPLLLIVLIPIVATIWFVDRSAHETRLRQQRAACERGNDIRRDQKLIVLFLVETARVLSVEALSPDVRSYYQGALPTLEEISGRIQILDCSTTIT